MFHQWNKTAKNDWTTVLTVAKLMKMFYCVICGVWFSFLLYIIYSHDLKLILVAKIKVVKSEQSK